MGNGPLCFGSLTQSATGRYIVAQLFTESHTRSSPRNDVEEDLALDHQPDQEDGGDLDGRVLPGDEAVETGNVGEDEGAQVDGEEVEGVDVERVLAEGEQ